ncbi:hypothetical protein [Pseudomonas sp. dw_612]|uniref:hypothetical protein n=1 Tax=Pseudomonas sp. dw_612 TaxID=2720080 RepID=UPI001BD1D7F8|nr:hypothetical protein [Pseudomonas sp. dw_612]
MRIRVISAVVILYLLMVAVSVVYTALFVWLIKKMIMLDGWVLNSVVGIIFVAQLFMSFRYSAPGLKAEVLGIEAGLKKQPLAAIYYEIITAAMLATFFIMMFVRRFFSLVGVLSWVITGLVFLIVFLGFFVRVKKLRCRSS